MEGDCTGIVHIWVTGAPAHWRTDTLAHQRTGAQVFFTMIRRRAGTPILNMVAWTHKCCSEYFSGIIVRNISAEFF